MHPIETPGGDREESLSGLLERIVGDDACEHLTLADLSDGLGERSFGFVLLLVALPAWIPVLPPPVRSVLGLPLGIVAVQMLLVRPGLSLPGWLGRLSIKRDRARRIVERARPWLQRTERLTRPRLERFAAERFQRRLGAFVLLNACLVAVPLPMTTSGPALATAVLAIGLIERDGGFVLAGLVLGLLAIAASVTFWLLVWFGVAWTLEATA